MAPRPLPPIHQAVDTGGQWIMAVGTCLVLVAAVILTVRLARRLGSVWPIVILASAGLASLCEPLYDNAFNLWFYDGPKTWALYRAFGGNPQPFWVPVTYVWVYGAQALWVWNRLSRGASRQDITKLIVTLWAVFTGFELVGINLGTYTYYGQHPFRLADFPVWLSLANVAIVVLVGIAVWKLQPLLSGLRQASLLVVVPAMFCLVSFGTSFPTLVVISHTNSSPALMWAAGAFSMLLGVMIISLATLAVPAAPARETARTQTPGDPAPSPLRVAAD
jgi:hypothetical protein